MSFCRANKILLSVNACALCVYSDQVENYPWASTQYSMYFTGQRISILKVSQWRFTILGDYCQLLTSAWPCWPVLRSHQWRSSACSSSSACSGRWGRAGGAQALGRKIAGGRNTYRWKTVASSPGQSQILSCSCFLHSWEIKSRSGVGMRLG